MRFISQSAQYNINYNISQAKKFYFNFTKKVLYQHDIINKKNSGWNVTYISRIENG